MNRLRRCGGWGVVMALVALMSSIGIRAQEGERGVSFVREIAPILVQKCAGCHGVERPKGRYQLHTFEALMKAGASDSAPIVAGEPGKSELFRLITSADADERMPQKDEALTREQIELIERWITQGAKFDGEDAKGLLAVVVAGASAHPRAPEVYPLPAPVLAVAFSPEGKKLAAGGYHEVTVWEVESGKLVERIGDLPQQIHGVVYGASGSVLAIAGGTPGVGGEVKLIDLEMPSRTRTLLKTAEGVYAVAFSPDGKNLAAGGADGAIHVFDVATGERKHLIEQHADWVLGVCYSGDGKYLASASRDKTARVFDAASGEMIHGYPGHSEPVYSVAFSADGERVYSAGRDRRVHVWKRKDGEKPENQIAGAEADLFRVIRVGEWLLTCGADGKIRHYRASDRELVRTMEGHRDWVYGLAVHEEKGLVASSSFDGEVRVWKLENGEMVKRFVAAPGVE